MTVIRQAPTMRPKVHLAKTKRNVAYNSSTDSFSSANVEGTTTAMNWYDGSGDNFGQLGDAPFTGGR